MKAPSHPSHLGIQKYQIKVKGDGIYSFILEDVSMLILKKPLDTIMLKY